MPQLADRVHDRGGERETRFDRRTRPALLPVWCEGNPPVLRWGTRDRSARKLPLMAWTWRESAGGRRLAQPHSRLQYLKRSRKPPDRTPTASRLRYCGQVVEVGTVGLERGTRAHGLRMCMAAYSDGRSRTM